MKYYKVVNYLNSPFEINTDTSNYGNRLVYQEYYSALINFVLNSSQVYNLPLDFYFTVNTSLSLWGVAHIDYIPRNGMVEVYYLTHKEIDKGRFIKESELYEIVDTIQSFGISDIVEGIYLWESIFEKARLKKYTNIPSRSESFFLFENIQDCHYYIKEHKGGDGIICEVELIEQKSLFKADMKSLDNIQNNFTFDEAIKYADNYWNGSATESPVFEFLFQGKCKLIPLSNT